MRGRFLIGEAALLGREGHTAWLHGFSGQGTTVCTVDLRTGQVTGRPYRCPGFSEDWYARATPGAWLYRGAGDLVLLAPEGVLHSFGPADTVDVTNGRVLVHHASRATIFDLASRVQLLSVATPGRCLTVLLDDSLVVIEGGKRSDFAMHGALIREMPNTKGSRVFATRSGPVESTVSGSGNGMTTRLSGAVSAQVSGIVWDLRVGPRGFVAAVIGTDHNVLFRVDGCDHCVSLSAGGRPRLFANGGAFLALGGGDALCWSEGNLERFRAPENLSMSGLLYEGKPVFLIREQLVMAGVPMFPLSTADISATIRREEWTSYACPDDSDEYPIVDLHGDTPDSDRLTLHMTEVPFGWAMVGWTGGTRTWHLEPIEILQCPISRDVDQLNVVDGWVRGRVADAAWDTLMRHAQTDGGREALSRMDIQLGGLVEDPFVEDPALMSFAHNDAQILYLAHHRGRLGVAGFDFTESKMHWRADSLGDFMVGHASAAPPTWFRRTYVDPPFDRIEVQLIDDPEHYERARLATAVGHLEWAVPEHPFDRRVIEVLARLVVLPDLPRTHEVLHRLIGDLGFRQAVLRSGLEVNSNQTRWAHPDIVIFANTHGLVRGPNNAVGVFRNRGEHQVWWGEAEEFFAGLPGSLEDPVSIEPRWFATKMASLYTTAE